MLDDYQAVLRDFRALQLAIKGGGPSPPAVITGPLSAAVSGPQSVALSGPPQSAPASHGAPLAQLEDTRPAVPPPLTEPSEAMRGMKEKVGTAVTLRGAVLNPGALLKALMPLRHQSLQQGTSVLGKERVLVCL